MSWAVSSADTPDTVTVWLLEDQPEVVRVAVRSVGGFAAPTSSAVREMLLDSGFPLTVLLVWTAPTSLAVGVQLLARAPTSEAFKVMLLDRAFPLTSCWSGQPPRRLQRVSMYLASPPPYQRCSRHPAGLLRLFFP